MKIQEQDGKNRRQLDRIIDLEIQVGELLKKNERLKNDGLKAVLAQVAENKKPLKRQELLEKVVEAAEELNKKIDDRLLDTHPAIVGKNEALFKSIAALKAQAVPESTAPK